MKKLYKIFTPFLIISIMFLVMPRVTHGAIFDHVQSKYGNATTVAFTTNTTAGNTIIIGVCGTVAQTVSDAQVNTYTLILTYTAGNCTNLRIYYAHNIVGGTTDTITFGGGGSRDYVVAEFSGDMTADVNKSASGTGTAVDSGNTAVTAAASELVYGFASTNASVTYTKGASFTAIGAQGVNNFDVANEYKTVSGTGAQSAQFTLNTSTGWDAIAVTFQASGPAAPVPYSTTTTIMGVTAIISSASVIIP